MLDQVVLDVLRAAESRHEPVMVQCFKEETARQGISPLLAVSVMAHENGRVGATSRNTDGSYDMGPMQINSIHLPELSRVSGLSQAQVRAQLIYDPCANLSVGVWLLRRAINREGSVWKGVASYHSRTPSKGSAYAWKVNSALNKIVARTPADALYRITYSGLQLALDKPEVTVASASR